MFTRVIPLESKTTSAGVFLLDGQTIYTAYPVAEKHIMSLDRDFLFYAIHDILEWA